MGDITTTMRSILASALALSLLAFGAATDCSQSGTRLDLPQGVTWLCQEHFQWHLTAEAAQGKCESKQVGFGGKEEKDCTTNQVVSTIDRLLSEGHISGFIKRRLLRNPDTLPLALGRCVEAMAYSFKIDGKLGDKLDGSDVNDPDGELPVSDRVLTKSQETAVKYKEKFGQELPTFFRRLHRQDVAAQTAAQFTGDTLIDRAILSGMLAVVRVKGSDADLLRSVLADLWSEEVKREHVEYSERKTAIASAMDSSGYSRQNFGYGRTYFYSFITLVETTPVLKAALEQPDSRMLVLGSSLGWQCFYAGLAYNTKTIGYELLEPRVSAATALAAKYNIPSDRVQFIAGDALTVPAETIKEATVILLTDLLWDDRLLSAVLNRIADDGTGGVVLVSNRGEGEKLGLLQKAEVEVKVSWKKNQRFFVQEKEVAL